MFVELLIKAQNNDHDALLELTEKFTPLLKKYTWILHYEDAYNELQLHLIETIHRLNINSLRQCNDAIVVTYLSKSIRTQYIKLSKQISSENNVLAFSQLNDTQLSNYEKITACDSERSLSSLLSFTDIKRVLSTQEYIVIQLIFEMGYTEAEIARANDKTRQAISQTKKRALKKLKSIYNNFEHK